MRAIEYCLAEAGIGLDELSCDRLLRQAAGEVRAAARNVSELRPAGIPFVSRGDADLAERKALSEKHAEAGVRELGGCTKRDLPKLLFAEHHQSHAASAFYPSPFERAAVLCLDGVGEWATTTAWVGSGNELTPLWEIDFPHSLGLLYSAFTYYTGFKVNSGEYKLMGLAPYGEPKYADLILDKLIDLKDDGTFRLDMQYFNYCTGLTMTNREVRRAVRRPAAAAGIAADPARDGPRRVDPGGHRRGRAAPRRARCTQRPAKSTCVWPAASR